MMARFIRIGVPEVLQMVDDAVDHRVMTRREALRFLEELATEVEVRIDWVRLAIQQQQRDEGS